MLVGWVIGIIVPIITYNEKGLFYEDGLTEVYCSLVLLRITSRSNTLSSLLLFKTNCRFYTKEYHLFLQQLGASCSFTLYQTKIFLVNDNSIFLQNNNDH